MHFITFAVKFLNRKYGVVFFPENLTRGTSYLKSSKKGCCFANKPKQTVISIFFLCVGVAFCKTHGEIPNRNGVRCVQDSEDGPLPRQ